LVVEQEVTGRIAEQPLLQLFSDETSKKPLGERTQTIRDTWSPLVIGRVSSLSDRGLRANQEPIDRCLSEVRAEVQVAGSIGPEADLHSCCASTGDPVEAGRYQQASEATPLVGIRYPHRLEKAHQRRLVEPEHRVFGNCAMGVFDGEIEVWVVQRTLSQPLLDEFTVPSDHRVRSTCTGHAIHDREPIDFFDRRTLHRIHPCSALKLVGRCEPILDGQARQRGVSIANEHRERAIPVLSGGRQYFGPDDFRVHDLVHREDIGLPGLTPRRKTDCANGADVIEPNRQRELVSLPRTTPPPLHVGGFPHATQRIGLTGTLQDVSCGVEPFKTPQQLASYDHRREP
jgi:hypothetical protein